MNTSWWVGAKNTKWRDSDRLHWEKKTRIRVASIGRGKSNLRLNRRKQYSAATIVIYVMGGWKWVRNIHNKPYNKGFTKTLLNQRPI